MAELVLRRTQNTFPLNKLLHLELVLALIFSFPSNQTSPHLMNGPNAFLLLVGILTSFCLQSQEICANGLDDDGDGLIDLNDTEDCPCFILDQVPSLLPNPSFEEFDRGAEGCFSQQPGGYPDRVAQANCLAGWRQASDGTTDAWNAFVFPGFPPIFPASIPQPIPSGSSCAGIWVGISDTGRAEQPRRYSH
jgi:hypothetical protein